MRKPDNTKKKLYPGLPEQAHPFHPYHHAGGGGHWLEKVESHYHQRCNAAKAIQGGVMFVGHLWAGEVAKMPRWGLRLMPTGGRIR